MTVIAVGSAGNLIGTCNGTEIEMSDRVGPKKKDAARDYPIILFADRAEWAEWLDRNHAKEPGVWLRLAKATSSLRSIRSAEALDIALCYGWIDGQAKGLDAETWLQKYTPRGRRSMWSKRNRENVARLIASGEMRPAGLAAIEAAKADGRWDRAYDSPGNATVPADLQAALDANSAAKAFFGTLRNMDRYAVLHRIQTAVKPETRARRIQKFVGMLQRGEKLR